MTVDVKVAEWLDVVQVLMAYGLIEELAIEVAEEWKKKENDQRRRVIK